MYVETILEVHHKYNALVLTAFNNDAGFVAALDKVHTVLLEGTNPLLQRDSPIQIKLTECCSSQSQIFQSLLVSKKQMICKITVIGFLVHAKEMLGKCIILFEVPVVWAYSGSHRDDLHSQLLLLLP